MSVTGALTLHPEIRYGVVWTRSHTVGWYRHTYPDHGRCEMILNTLQDSVVIFIVRTGIKDYL